LSDVFRLGAPAGVEVRVLEVAQAARHLLEGGMDKGRCLLLVKTPESALSLLEEGVPLQKLNVGNVAAGPGSKRMFKTVSLTGKQMAVLDSLTERGVEIVFQQTPEDRRASWEAVRRRHRS
jgi:PTS system mannose-specific IIB component